MLPSRGAWPIPEVLLRIRSDWAWCSVVLDYSGLIGVLCDCGVRPIVVSVVMFRFSAPAPLSGNSEDHTARLTDQQEKGTCIVLVYNTRSSQGRSHVFVTHHTQIFQVCLQCITEGRQAVIGEAVCLAMLLDDGSNGRVVDLRNVWNQVVGDLK